MEPAASAAPVAADAFMKLRRFTPMPCDLFAKSLFAKSFFAKSLFAMSFLPVRIGRPRAGRASGVLTPERP
jgi:hypothetical protein